MDVTVRLLFWKNAAGRYGGGDVLKKFQGSFTEPEEKNED